jgi:hypothetical protein
MLCVDPQSTYDGRNRMQLQRVSGIRSVDGVGGCCEGLVEHGLPNSPEGNLFDAQTIMNRDRRRR